MSYKVFFVEDEIVTREGIRDNVDWQANGFELCGEAPDGEMALPLLQAAKPDVLITDIKMPFMDGLELSRIVRDRLPHTKIVILSGHDEFEYAQQAIKLGVTEYLLKPITVQDMHRALKRVAVVMDREGQEQENLRKLQLQVQENRAALTERLLLNLLVGAISLSDAIEQSEELGVSLLARCYCVVVIHLAAHDGSMPRDLLAFRQVRDTIAERVQTNPDVFVLHKDLEELVLILKGDTPALLQEDRDMLLEQIRREIPAETCKLSFGIGGLGYRITDMGQSFLEALADLQTELRAGEEPNPGAMEATELLRVDKAAVLEYLKCGVKQDFDEFFDAFLLPLGETTLHCSVAKNYIFLDLIFTTARFVQELGGQVNVVLPELDHMDALLANIESIEQFREQVHTILSRALTFRDGQANGQHTDVLLHAKEYIEQHYMEPDLSLQSVARQVGHSPCHFSTVFAEEIGKTFKTYLTETRIRRAKELMRTTTLRSSEIADRIGYNDPHYFSLVFRKSTGMTPKEFRLQAQQI